MNKPTIKTTCQICNQEVLSIPSHLKTHNISTEEYYNTFIRTNPNENICEMYSIISTCRIFLIC